MEWIKRLFGKAPHGPSEADVASVCSLLREKLQQLGTSPQEGEEKALDIKVSQPLEEALVDSENFLRVCGEYLEAGWRLDCMATGEGMLEMRAAQQGRHVFEP